MNVDFENFFGKNASRTEARFLDSPAKVHIISETTNFLLYFLSIYNIIFFQT